VDEQGPLHQPVLPAEVVSALAPQRGGLFVDCTVGAGGHARLLLESGATRVIGIDRDTSALRHAARTLAPWSAQVELVHGDYRTLAQILDDRGVAAVDGLLADLGVSSIQLDTPGRGFSFRRDEPLDMRMDVTSGEPAAAVLAGIDEADLSRVIFEYGEERYARRIARAIARARSEAPITTTGRLAEIVRRAIPRRGYTRIDPATRTFQALRIHVNRELDGLEVFLRTAAARLAPAGRLAIIAFHSLEDRVVKHTLRAMQSAGDVPLRLLTRRPVTAADDEVARNPRARSAKLRAAVREDLEEAA